MSLLAGQIAGIAGILGAYGNAPELLRKKPGPHSAGAATDALHDALEAHVAASSPNNPIEALDTKTTKPEEISLRKFIQNSDNYASYQRATPTQNPGYAINPNADRAFLAHELGHVAYGQTDAGSMVQKLRGGHPRLAKAIGAAALLTPALSSALTPGDDDFGQALMLATALNTPAIIDEFEANRRGLDILKRAGMTATPGQRARLAGGMLSYLARPVAMAAGGQFVGNMLD